MSAHRIKFVVAVLALCVLTATVLVAYVVYERVKAEQEQQQAIENLLAKPPPAPDLGAQEYERAMDLIEAKEIASARTVLGRVVEVYPDSQRHGDARRALGEVNMDRLLSQDPLPEKIEHTVERGESLAAIAEKHRSTIDFVRKINGLVSDALHPGDRILVMPLEFELLLDKSDNELVLTRKGQFFKAYPIEELRLPGSLRLPYQSKIDDKICWIEGKRATFTDERYNESSKWLQTTRRSGRLGIIFCSISENETQGGVARVPLGVFLSPSDIEELFTIIRLETPTKIVQ